MKNFKLLLFALQLPFFGISQQLISEYNLKNPLGFQENKGQMIDQNGSHRHDIKFTYNAPGLKVHFKLNGWSFELYQFEDNNQVDFTSTNTDKSNYKTEIEDKDYTTHIHRVDVELKNANTNPIIVKEDKSEDYVNFYTYKTPEAGILNVYTYKKITYKNIWKNIDIEWVAIGEELKYNVILHPGANPKDIQLAYQGAEEMKILDEKIQTSVSFNKSSGIESSTLSESIPAVYGAKGASFNLKNNTIGFDIVGWDGKNKAVIDPLIVWGTYFGGASTERAYGVAIDSSDFLYITGYTSSTSSIATSGAHQTFHESTLPGAGFGGNDAILIKFNANGVRQWGTYYGGIESEVGFGVAVDRTGSIYFTGRTGSTTHISTSGTHQDTIGGDTKKFGGDDDAFLAKFNAAGVRLWATYYGGENEDLGEAISFDNSNNVFLTGKTASTKNISSTVAHQKTYGGGYFDAFLVKFNSSGVRQFGTYYGGSSEDGGRGVAVDSMGNVFVTGYTNSYSNISTSGVHQFYNNGYFEAFLVKFNNNGVRQWCTYFGGYERDEAYGIEIDFNGNIYITGETQSTSNIATPGSHQTTLGGQRDAFLVKFNSSGVRQWATYYGGSGNEYGYGIALDFLGDIYFVGQTYSLTNIATPIAHQTTITGTNNAFLVKFKQNGSRQMATYYGGNLQNIARAVAVTKPDIMYIVGYTTSTNKISTPGAHRTGFGGDSDAFIARFKKPVEDIKSFEILLPETNRFCLNDSFNFSARIINQGMGVVKNFYYIFELTGIANLKDSVWVDSLEPNIAKDITLNKYVELLNTGNALLKMYPRYFDDSASNDTLKYQITISPFSEGGNSVGDTLVCSGFNSGVIKLSNRIGIVENWQASTDKGLTWDNLNFYTSVYTFNNLIDTTLYRALIKNGACPTDTSTVTEVSVFPNSIGGTTTGSKIVTKDVNSGVIYLSDYRGNITKWQSSINGGVSWTDISNTNDSLTFSNLSVTTHFRAVVKNGFCSEDFSSISIITIDDINSIGSAINLSKLNIYPNPVKPNQLIQIEINSLEVNDSITIEIISLNGQVFKNLTVQRQANILELEIPSNLTSSTYFMKIITNNQVWIAKIIVED